MKEIISFIIVLSIFIINVPAQNFSWQQTNGPAGGYIRSLVRTANGILLAGTDAGVYKSTDQGENWSLSSGAIGYSYIYSIAVSPNGTIFAGTFYDYIFRSTDEGNSWTQVGFNVPFIIDAMAVKSDGTVFAATEESDGSGSGSVYRSTNNGSSWTEVNTGLPSIVVRQIRIDENGSVFAATFGGLYKSTNDGASWTLLTNGISSSLVRDIAINPLNNYIFASGSNTSSNPAVLRSTDGGSTFTQLSFPNNNRAQTLDVSPAGHLFAGTTRFSPSLGYGIYRSTDNGDTFVEVDSSLSVKRFAFGIADQIFAGSNLGIHRSPDDGNNWMLEVSGMYGVKINVLAADHVDNIYAGTNNGPYRSTDYGDTWQLMGDFIQLRSTSDMAVSSNGYIFIVNDNGNIFRSTDAGENWVQLPIAAGQGALYCSSNDYLFFGPPFQGVYRSTDYGNSWTQQNSGLPAATDVQDFTGDPSGKIYAGAEFGIYQSADYGDSWSPYSTYNSYLDHIAANASGDLFWAYSDAYSNENEIYRSTDGGATYTQLTVVPGNAGVITDVLISPDQNIFVSVTDNTVGGVYRSTDNGDTFEQINDGLTEQQLTALAVDAQMHLLAGTTRGVFRSIQIVPVELSSFNASVSGNDVILNWETATEKNNKGFEVEKSQKSNPPAGETGVKSQKWQRIGFVEGNGTTTGRHTYRFTDNDVSPAKYVYRLKQIDYDGSYKYSNEVEVGITFPLKFSLEQNYPNPFNPVTTIKYSIPDGGNTGVGISFMKFTAVLKVYDVLGNEIVTLVNEEKPPGTYEVKFNGSTLPSGVYIYRLNAGDYSAAKKLVLLK